MRVSEAAQQGRPKGAERLHIAFHRLFTDYDNGSGISSTAAGTSAQAVPFTPSLAKSSTLGMRASASVSPSRQRRAQQRRQQPQHQATKAVSAKPSPIKGTPVGNTTSAVISALAMDAALPDLDATARALLESIMGNCSSSCPSPSLEYMGPSSVNPGKTPASALARSPLGPTARISASASPHTVAGDSVKTASLTQHHHQRAQALRQQYHQQQALGSGPYAAAMGGAEAVPMAANGGHEGCRPRNSRAYSQSPPLAYHHQQQRYPHSQPWLQSSKPCHDMPTQLEAQAQAQFGTGAAPSCWMEGTGGAAALKVKTPTSQSTHAEHFNSLPPQLQELLRPPTQPQQPGPQFGLSMPSENSFLTSGELGADAKAHPGEESLQARTSRLLQCPSDSSPARRPLGSLSAINIQQSATAAAAAVAASGGTTIGAGTAPASPGSRTLVKRLCRSHAAGSMSSKLLKSPKDDSRRPMTYAELQSASKVHQNINITNSNDQTSSLQQHNEQEPLQGLQASLSPTFAAALGRKTQGGGPGKATATAAANSTDDRGDALVDQDNAAAKAEDVCPSGPDCAKADRLSSSSASGPARVTPFGHNSPGRFNVAASLVLPETITERGSTSAISDSKTPTDLQQPLVQPLQKEVETEEPGIAGAAFGDAAHTPDQPKTTPRRGGGFFGGLFACFGKKASGSENVKISSRSQPPPPPPSARARGWPAAEPVAAPSDAQPARPKSEATGPVEAAVAQLLPPATPPLGPKLDALEAAEPQQIGISLQTDDATIIPPAPTATVAAVAAALCMSPTSAAAHVGADSRLLMLLEAELARLEPTASAGGTPSGGSPANRATNSGARGSPKGILQSAQQQRSPLAGGVSDGTSHASAVNRDGQQQGNPQATSPAPVQALKSKSAALSGFGSPDALASATRKPRGPVDQHHLRYEDGDSVLRGSVDFRASTAAVATTSFSSAVPTSRPRAVSALTATGCSAPRGPRQPPHVSMDAAAAVGTSGGGRRNGDDRSSNGAARHAFLEPPELSSCGASATDTPSPPQRQQCSSGLDPGPSTQTQTPPGSNQHGNLQGLVMQHLVSGDAGAPNSGKGTPDGATAVPGLRLSGLNASITSSIQQAPRSSRKRSRATHASFGGGALSQLDARKLAAMPLEEMLERIQAAIVAEDLAAGRTIQQDGTSIGLSDGGAILPMPPVVAKARLGQLRRRKSTAGGRVGGAGLHSGGGGGGNPSRGGRSSDGGTRGGATGVGVQATLMKAAAVAAGAGRRRRRVKNRSPTAARRRQMQAQNAIPPTMSFTYVYGNQPLAPVSPNGRKSDGAGTYGQPVWRHGGRALAFSGFGFAGSTSGATTSPRSSCYDPTFTRAPPYKKPPMSTPGAPSSSSVPLGFGATTFHGPGTGGGAGGSPPRLRPSAPSAPTPLMIAVTKSPMLSKTPSSGNANVRTSQKALDGDDATALRSALLTSSSGPKGAMLVASTAGAPKKPNAAAPVTSSLNISDLLSRYNIHSLAMSAGGALQAASSGNRLDAGRGSPAVFGHVKSFPGSQQQQRQQLDRDSDCAACRGATTGGGLQTASPAAATAAEPMCSPPQSAEGSERTTPVTRRSHEGLAEDDGLLGGDDSVTNKPRIASVSLTELFQQASGLEKDRRSLLGCGSGRGSTGGNHVPEATEEEMADMVTAAPERAPLDTIAETLSASQAPPVAAAATISSSSSIVSSPSILRRYEQRTSKVAALQRPLVGTSPSGGGFEEQSSESARGPAGYLELLQVYGQASSARAVALPHYAMPIMSRATSAGGGGGRTSLTAETTSVESPARSPVGRPSALSAGGRSSQVMGSYAQIAVLRSLTSGASRIISTIAGKAPQQPAGLPVPNDVAKAPATARMFHGIALPDAASATGSPTFGLPETLPSPSTSSVVAQMPSAMNTSDSDGLTSTAAVRSCGVRQLEDTADSGVAGSRQSQRRLKAVTGASAGDVMARGGSGRLEQIPRGEEAADGEEVVTAPAAGTGSELLTDQSEQEVAAKVAEEEVIMANDSGESGSLAPEQYEGMKATKHAEEVEVVTVLSGTSSDLTQGQSDQDAAAQVAGCKMVTVHGACSSCSSLPGPVEHEARVSEAERAAEGMKEEAEGREDSRATADTNLLKAAAGSQPISGTEMAAVPPTSLQLEQQVAGRVSPLQLELPSTPRSSDSPFADWRCVPLEAYDAALEGYDSFLVAPTTSGGKHMNE
ncbi:hypothetical protein VOLCADRAFT_98559 [Volvox carteri f. nagariensis]|uniref:Uncharacterized protein n=1 Tax=Volvox carteri f. nagariensis TaxID=3068 RepID=D8UFN7_VOLCA|nr:uncharacterized protein VOLCADRAFT_98559 [Volvox carteri f. nagariensis]EFJ41533.1 hypothetical protein VOLCADRAFT_98559 [Volvox carteri f. nagariensis]|eukprot:XP_002957478.1 hypothetical protein VOLCADRAFT_98559 [Volvox carteri f. nagariensis]